MQDGPILGGKCKPPYQQVKKKLFDSIYWHAKKNEKIEYPFVFKKIK